MTPTASNAPKAQFRTKLPLAGTSGTGFEVPAKVVESLGAGKGPAVKLTTSGHTYRSTVALYDGKSLVGRSAADRESAGVATGDILEVELALDSAPRQVAVPKDFAAALKRDKDAKRPFNELSCSRQQWLVLSIVGTKTSETRARRIAKAVMTLREGKS